MERDPELASAYRAGAQAMPPAHLDDAIRAAARREVAAGPRRTGVRRWAVPASLAAMIVLSVSVVTLMREQGADRPELLIRPKSQALERQGQIVQPVPGEPPAAVPGAPETQAKRRPPAPSVGESPAPLPQTATAPAPSVSGLAADVGPRASDTESRAKAATADASRTEQIAEPASARREYAPLLRSTPAPMGEAAGNAGIPTAKPAAPAALSAPDVLWRDLVREPAETWLQRIAELRRIGKTADADALAAEFRRRFPDRRLPEDAP